MEKYILSFFLFICINILSNAISDQKDSTLNFIPDNTDIPCHIPRSTGVPDYGRLLFLNPG